MLLSSADKWTQHTAHHLHSVAMTHTLGKVILYVFRVWRPGLRQTASLVQGLAARPLARNAAAAAGLHVAVLPVSLPCRQWGNMLSLSWKRHYTLCPEAYISGLHGSRVCRCGDCRQSRDRPLCSLAGFPTGPWHAK